MGIDMTEYLDTDVEMNDVIETFLVCEMCNWNNYLEMDPQLNDSDSRKKLRKCGLKIREFMRYTISDLFFEKVYFDEDLKRPYERKIKPVQCLEYRKQAIIVLLSLDELRRRIISNPWSKKGTNYKKETWEEMVEKMKHLNIEIRPSVEKYMRKSLVCAEELCNDLYLWTMMRYALATGIGLDPESIYSLILRGRLLGLHQSVHQRKLREEHIIPAREYLTEV